MGNSNPDKNTLLARQRIETIVREEWGKLLSCMISYLGDFQLAEDALQDSLESALNHWQRNGLPRSPQAWLLQTARRKAIDRLRRVSNFSNKQAEYQLLLEMDKDTSEGETMQEIPDERLRLIFTCCHPALDKKSQTVLTLRTLGGLKTLEIARAFLDSEHAIAQRLVRAKRKIKVAAIPYIVPEADQWDLRLNVVLEVLYLIFNEGYFSTHGDTQIRKDLSNEALRLVDILMKLKPGQSETEGLLALMLLHNSRISARQDQSGAMIALDEQDRQLWDREKIDQGLAMLDQALRRIRPGPYQIQAAISAIHAQAESHQTTNWTEIILLYDELYKLHPNPVVRLNQAVAISYAKSPQDALDLLWRIEDELVSYQPFYASKADFLRRIGDINGADTAYRKAIELSDEIQTKNFLEKKLGVMISGR